MELFPQIQQYFDHKFEWGDMVDMKLHKMCNLYVEFHECNVRKLDLMLGKTTIDFKTLKTMMVDSVYKCLDQATHRCKKDTLYDSSYELNCLWDAAERFENLTKKEFDKCFNDMKRWEALFPYLYRLELAVNWDLSVEIINYSVFNGLELSKEIMGMTDSYQFHTHEIVSKSLIKKAHKEIIVNIETNKMVNDIMSTLYSPTSPHVNLDLLKRKLVKELSHLDKEKFNRNSKLNSIL